MDSSTLLGIIFLVVGALVVLSEIYTLTIYLLAVAVGLFAAGGLALAGGSLTADLALLAAVIILGLPAAHWWRRQLKNRAADEVTHDDVGHTVTVVGGSNRLLQVNIDQIDSHIPETYDSQTLRQILGPTQTSTP